MASFAPKLPMYTSNGKFVVINDSLQNIKQKLKMLILTSPGEKIMEPDFGVGIKKYLFEGEKSAVSYTFDEFGQVNQTTLTSLSDIVKQKIISQAVKYIPDIKITAIESQVQNNNMLYLKIKYNIKNIISDTLELQVQ
jgi:hypothetical protein